MLTTIALVLATASADTDPTEVCPSVGRTAGAIMEARQSGVPLSTAMEIVSDNEFWRAVVLQAYAARRYSTDNVRADVILDFATHYELACYAALG
jgi:hypothetical protein